jgi:DNA (cytosine-5)-methyltransferase 1
VGDAERGSEAGAVNGFWRNAVWLPCRDGKARPVEPGTFPLVDGTPARVVRLRGYGNAINAEQACAFIETVMELP